MQSLSEATPTRTGPGIDPGDRNWRWWVLLFWIAASAVMISQKWSAIHYFWLGDTDDNMRMAQVRAWLSGQGWYDLRQYKLDPPRGASIHWTRLVDLPIAGIILLVRPFAGGAVAEMAAAAIAPLIPLGLAFYSVALTARRLVARAAYPLAAAILTCAQAMLLMFMPERIDHHGWQLALLITTVAGTVDARRLRGGIVAGLSSAVSLTIGLEMLPYIAVAGAATALRWAWDADEAERLRGYGIALAAGSAVGFAAFASYDNRAAVCDVLSPVWLSVTLAAGGLAVVLTALPLAGRPGRFAAAALVGAAIAGGFALAWPDCLGRPEHISPELDRLWFKNIREAKPLYQHSYRIALPVVALPVMGLIGGGFALWRARGSALFAVWLTPALLASFATGLLLWQTRAGPAAQLLAVPGATALGWALLPPLSRHRRMAVRVAGTFAAFLLVSGLFMALLLKAIPEKAPTSGRKAVNSANGRCPTLAAMQPIARLPAATVLTFVDLGPRLITITHHRAIAGPYHRNQQAILDVHHAFRGSAGTAHAVMRRHGATLLLLCPGMSESTIYAAENKQGFYMQLMRGEVPGWLAPVALPSDSPFRLWRRVG